MSGFEVAIPMTGEIPAGIEPCGSGCPGAAVCLACRQPMPEHCHWDAEMAVKLHPECSAVLVGLYCECGAYGSASGAELLELCERGCANCGARRYFLAEPSMYATWRNNGVTPFRIAGAV